MSDMTGKHLWLSLGFNTKLVRSLTEAGIETREQLRQMTNDELLRLPNFGNKYLWYVRCVFPNPTRDPWVCPTCHGSGRVQR